MHEIALRCRTLEALFENRQVQASANISDVVPLMAGVPIFGDGYNESVHEVLGLLEIAVLDLKVRVSCLEHDRMMSGQCCVHLC